MSSLLTICLHEVLLNHGMIIGRQLLPLLLVVVVLLLLLLLLLVWINLVCRMRRMEGN